LAVLAATSVYLIVFRIVHVLAAVAWGGSVYLFVIQIQPTAAALGPAGAPFMRELLGNQRTVDRILMLASATIIGGAFLYWHDWQVYGGFGDFVGSAFGLALTVGAVSALVAFAIGIFGTRPGARRLLDLGGQAAEAGATPSPELAGEIQRTQAKLKLLARANLLFVGIATLAMATARYW
jgi:hypothetical protein